MFYYFSFDRSLEFDTNSLRFSPDDAHFAHTTTVVCELNDLPVLPVRPTVPSVPSTSSTTTSNVARLSTTPLDDDDERIGGMWRPRERPRAMTTTTHPFVARAFASSDGTSFALARSRVGVGDDDDEDDDDEDGEDDGWNEIHELIDCEYDETSRDDEKTTNERRQRMTTTTRRRTKRRTMRTNGEGMIWAATPRDGNGARRAFAIDESGKVEYVWDDLDDGESEDEGRVRGRVELTRAKGAKSEVTRAKAVDARRGFGMCVVGDSNGALYLVKATKDGITSAAFDRRNHGHAVDDSDGGVDVEGGDGDATVDGSTTPMKSPLKSPTKSRKWSALKSATAGVGALLRRNVNAGGIRSLSLAPGNSEHKRRLLSCDANGTLEEWSLDVTENGAAPKLTRVHRAHKMIAKALRVSSNVALIAADWIVGDSGDVDITVLAECEGRGSLHRLHRSSESDALTMVASAVPPAGALPSSLAGAKFRIDGDDALIIAGDGSTVMFSGVDFSRVTLQMDAATNDPIVDACCVRPGEWLVLTRGGGISVFNPHVTASGRQTTPRPSTQTATTPSKRATGSRSKAMDSPGANPVDDSVAMECVRSLFEEFYAGHGGAPGHTKSELRASGAFVSNSAPFAMISKGLIDALPKKLSGKSTRGGPPIEDHITEKLNRHLAFLEFLNESGVWTDIDIRERAEMLTHGEMIAALAQLRSLQMTSEDSARIMLEEITARAGAAIKSADAALDERSDIEVCFSRASEARQLPAAVAQVLDAHVNSANATLENRALVLDTCARGLLIPLEAAGDFRRRRTGMYPLSSSGSVVNWTCEIQAREALRSLAHAAIKLRIASISSGKPGLAPVLGSRLLAVAAPLLDACAANVNAALPSSTERNHANKEYLADRKTVLPVLLECAKHSATVPRNERPQHGSLSEGVDVSIESVAAVAESHFGYQELFTVCDTPEGTARLHHYMRTLLGAQEDGEESFSYFVYRKLALEDVREAVLLRDIPAEFHSDLEQFLAPHPTLRWIMELRVGKYLQASETLVDIGNRSGASANERRRALSIAKLSALAAGCGEHRIDEIDQALTNRDDMTD